LAVALNQQLRNPVSMFTTDNNGVIIQLPVVADGGQTSTSGSLVFGIGTESNNGLGSAVVLPIDTNINDAAFGGFTTVFNGKSFPGSTAVLNSSFIDSGSNAIVFLDPPTSGIKECTIDTGFYCPPSTLSLSAVNQAIGGASRGVAFKVANAETLFTNNGGSNFAFSDLGAPAASGVTTPQVTDGFFDWGLPFFFGRNVYTAIQGVTPPSGIPAGPFWAY
jgi:hypothetical protein